MKPAYASLDASDHDREPHAGTTKARRHTKITKITKINSCSEEFLRVLRFSSCLRGSVRAAMKLRVAVIGVGHLGRHHARILGALPGVELVAVVDTNRTRADEIAAAHGARAAYDACEVMGQVDAVTVAVPTERHCDVALPFLQAGVAVLVEKPMARSIGEADAMIA